MRNNSARERDVERRLARLESPEPPADLLGRIQADIPDHLRSLDEPAGTRPPRARLYRLAAASVLLAAVAGLLAYRVFQTAPEPASVTASFDGQTTPEPPSKSEIGDRQPASAAAEVQSGQPAAGPRPADPDASPSPSATARQQPVAGETGNGTADDRLRERLRVLPPPPPATERDRLEPGRPARTTEVGPAAPEAPPAEPVDSEAAETVPVSAEEVTVVEQVRFVPPPTRQAAATVLDTGPTAGPGLRAKRLQDPAAPRPAAPPSTGGTAEPNDQPWGDMFFRPYGTNPFVDTEDDARSTFGLDVDTGSYTLARSYLERGHLPPPEAIRVEEFLNYFDYGDPAPRRGEFALTTEGAPSPWARGPRYQLLRIGLHGRQVDPADRRDSTLIFVVDVSGSMARDDRIGLVKRSLRLLLDQLGPGDRVGLVTYGSHGQVLLEPTGDLPAVRRAIDRLTTGGSTNAEEGLVLAYELARRHDWPESLTRLVLCSDGVANVGRTGPESILERVGREAAQGIELTTVGFGMGNYNDVLMEQLADQGDGNYAYVDSLAEARRIFVESLTGTLQTIATDAKIQVEFDPRAVSRYRLLGYENRDVPDDRFRDDSVDAGEIGAGHRVTALYEIKLAEGASRRGRLAEVRLRYRSRATGQVVEESLEVRRSDLATSWRAASPSLRLAALAAELAEVLKGSYWARDRSPEELRRRAAEVQRAFAADPDAAELVRLARLAFERLEWPQE